MRNLYAGLLVLVLCGATILSLGGCQENLALLGDDVGGNKTALVAMMTGNMSLESTQEKPLAAKPDEKLYTLEEISAMMAADAMADASQVADKVMTETGEKTAENKEKTAEAQAEADTGVQVLEPEISRIVPLETAAGLENAAEVAAVVAKQTENALPELNAENAAPALAAAAPAESPAEADENTITMPDMPAVVNIAAVDNNKIELPGTLALEGALDDVDAGTAEPKLPQTAVAAESDADKAVEKTAADEALPELELTAEDTVWRDQLLDDVSIPDVAVQPAITENDNEEAEKPEETAETTEEKTEEKTDENGKAEETPAETAAVAETPAADVPAAEKPAEAEKSPVNELVAKESIRQQALDVEANHYFKIGTDAFAAGRYDEALNAFDRALQIKPDMAEVAEARTRARQLVGRPTGDQDGALLDDIVRQNSARLKEREMRLNAGLEKASEYYLKTVAMDAARKVMSRQEQIQVNLIDLDAAEQSLNAVRSLLLGSGLPRDMEKGLEMRGRALSAQISQEREKLVNERAAIDRQTAADQVRETQKNATREGKQEINEMLSSVEYHLSRNEFEEALTRVEKILSMDKNNATAQALRKEIRFKSREKENLKNAEELRNAEENWALDVQEAYIFPRQEVVYPLDWDRIRQRARKMSESVSTVSSSERELMEKLSRISGNFEYNGQTLSEVMADFQQRAKICISINGDDIKDKEVKTARLSGVTMKQALDQIVEDLGVKYKYEDEALIVYPPAENAGAAVMKVYTVVDLIKKSKAFRVKKRMVNNIATNGEGGGDALMGDDDDDDDDDDEDWSEDEDFNIVDVIKNQIGESFWDDGHTINQWEDHVIVFNTPEVHARIEKYLEELRKTSKMQVYTEGRFMDISDDLYNTLGINWSGAQQRQYGTHNGSAKIQTGLGYAGTTLGSTMNGLKTAMNMRMTNNPLNLALNTLQLNLSIQAAETTGKTSILHNPKLLVQNGMNAFCQIILETSYLSNYTVSGSNMIPTVSQIYDGVTWEVRPVVSFDKRYIMMKVRPEISQKLEVDEYKREIPGLSNFQEQQHIETELQGGENSDGGSSLKKWFVDLERPVMRITDFWTNVIVPDGGTVMIGGQLRDNSKNEISGVPVLSSVPYLGRLMRTDYMEKKAVNRVIMVSGKIVEMED